MVGLVLVGHSAEVVAGLAAMVRQAAPGVPVETAGGLSGGRLGTSGPDVAAALRRALEASRGAGVVVLLDLGSAALALDIALDELDDEADRARVRVTEAPFVEGAVIAGVASAGGGDAGVVVAAAEGAMRMPKLPARVTADRRRATWRAHRARLARRLGGRGRRAAHLADGPRRGDRRRRPRHQPGPGAHGGRRRSRRRRTRRDGGRRAAPRRRRAAAAGRRRRRERRALRPGADPGRRGPVRHARPGDPAGETALAAAIDAIADLGKAVPGDKTMLDALLPAMEALRTAPADEAPAHACARAAAAAGAGADATIPLVARKGRASYLGERSAGHRDPGAASSVLLLRCLARRVRPACRPTRVRHAP